jgi:hypothetical protein
MKSLSKKNKRYKRVTKKVYIGSGNQELPVEPPPPTSMTLILNDADKMASKAGLGSAVHLMINASKLNIHLEYKKLLEELLFKNNKNIENTNEMVEMFYQQYLKKSLEKK